MDSKNFLREGEGGHNEEEEEGKRIGDQHFCSSGFISNRRIILNIASAFCSMSEGGSWRKRKEPLK
jgi:hypothetical protein